MAFIPKFNAPTTSLDNKEELMEEGSLGAEALHHADAEDEKENNEEKETRKFSINSPYQQ